MIVRNEEHNLADCLAQVADLVSEIVVVDTGLTDRTRQVASALGARVFDFPWCDDFSAARNEALRHATGQWIFWLDADDRLDEENHRRLARVVAGLDGQRAGYAMHCVSLVKASDEPPAWVSQVRLFPAAAGLHWQRRVHEMLVADDPGQALDTVVTDVMVRHCGYENVAAWRKKIQRNLRLLQLEFALDPDNAQTLFYLGWTYCFLRNLPAGEGFLRRSLRRDPHHRPAYHILSKVLLDEGRHDDAAEVCRAGLREFPDDRELRDCSAQIAVIQNHVQQAQSLLEGLLRQPAATRYYLAETAELVSKIHSLLGRVYQRIGRGVDSEQQFLTALQARPDFIDAWIGLGELYLGLENWPQFEAANARLAALAGGRLPSQIQQARFHLIRREFAPSRRLLEEVLAEDPTLAWPQTVMLEQLRLEGADVEQQLRLAEEILTHHHGYALVRARREQLERQHKLLAADTHRPAAEAPALGSCVVVAG